MTFCFLGHLVCFSGSIAFHLNIKKSLYQCILTVTCVSSLSMNSLEEQSILYVLYLPHFRKSVLTEAVLGFSPL